MAAETSMLEKVLSSLTSLVGASLSQRLFGGSDLHALATPTLVAVLAILVGPLSKAILFLVGFLWRATGRVSISIVAYPIVVNQYGGLEQARRPTNLFLRLASAVASLECKEIELSHEYEYGKGFITLPIQTRPCPIPAAWYAVADVTDVTITIREQQPSGNNNNNGRAQVAQVTLVVSGKGTTGALKKALEQLVTRPDLSAYLDEHTETMQQRLRICPDEDTATRELQARIEAEAVVVPALSSRWTRNELYHTIMSHMADWDSTGMRAAFSNYGKEGITFVPLASASQSSIICLGTHDVTDRGMGVISVYGLPSEEAPSAASGSTDFLKKPVTFDDKPIYILSSAGKEAASNFVRQINDTLSHMQFVLSARQGDDEAKKAELYWARQPRIKVNVAVVSDTVRQALVDDALRFKLMLPQLKEVGAPARRSYLAYGPPGTGKSTLAAVVAEQLGWTLVIVNMDLVKTAFEFRLVMQKLSDTLMTAPHVVVMDDFDRCDYIKSLMDEEKSQAVTTLLNYLDGTSASVNRILIASVNDYAFMKELDDELGNALLRKGRFDHRVPVESCDGPQLRRLFSSLTLPATQADVKDADARLDALRGKVTLATAFSLSTTASGDARRFLEELEADVAATATAASD
jgi:hypothetical protein